LEIHLHITCLSSSMKSCVVCLRRQDFEVSRRIVPLVAVNVVDDLAFVKRPTENGLRHPAVFMPAEHFAVGLAVTCTPSFSPRRIRDAITPPGLFIGLSARLYADMRPAFQR
jgi:hypothetical protein